MNTEPTQNTEPTTKTTESLETVLKDLAERVNPTTLAEGLNRLAVAIEMKDSSNIMEPMREGAKEFEERVGRPMTYGEMRQMWG
jgi:hypothetical protein